MTITIGWGYVFLFLLTHIICFLAGIWVWYMKSHHVIDAGFNLWSANVTKDSALMKDSLNRLFLELNVYNPRFAGDIFEITNSERQQ